MRLQLILLPLCTLFVRQGLCQQTTSSTFKCFAVFPNRFLEHSGTLKIKVPNVERCLSRCLNAERLDGFTCRSVMWQRASNTCILSQSNSQTMPNNLRVPVNMDVDLFENKCLRKPNVPRKPQLHQTIVHGVPVRSPHPEIIRQLNAPRPLQEPIRQLDGRTQHHLIPRDITISGDSMLRKEEKVRFGIDDVPSKLYSQAPVRDVTVTRHTSPTTSSTSDDTTTTTTGTSTSTTDDEDEDDDDEEEEEDYGDDTRTTIVTRTEGTTLDAELQPQNINDIQELLNHSTTPSSPQQPSEACFRVIRNHWLLNFVEKTIVNTDQQTCLLECQQAEGFFCASANFDRMTQMCTLNGGSALLNMVDLTTAASGDYYENLCHRTIKNTEIPQEIIQSTTMGRCLKGTKNVLLLSLKGSIDSSASTLGDCLSMCLLSKTRRNKPCTAMNWMPSTNSCMLFDDVIIDKSLISSVASAIYYTNQCSDEEFEQRQKILFSGNDYYDDAGL